MSKFRDELKADFATFINPEEFGEQALINKVPYNVLIDEDEFTQRNLGNNAEGLSNQGLIFYVSADEYPYHFVIDQALNFNGVNYKVTDFQLDEGLYTVTLGGARAWYGGQ